MEWVVKLYMHTVLKLESNLEKDNRISRVSAAAALTERLERPLSASTVSGCEARANWDITESFNWTTTAELPEKDKASMPEEPQHILDQEMKQLNANKNFPYSSCAIKFT